MQKSPKVNKSMALIVASAVSASAQAAPSYSTINLSSYSVDKDIYNVAVDASLDPAINKVLADNLGSLNGTVSKDGEVLNADMLLATYQDSTTAAGGYGCYSNCYSNCHGSRNWR